MAPSPELPPSEGATTGGGASPAGHVSGAPEVGAIVDRYTILERVGAGGMGEVYAAYDAKLDRKVALKLLRHKGADYEARLMREAQAMARLSHHNVVAVFDTGRVGRKLYLAMEFVRGATLHAWQKDAPRTLPEILRVYVQAGEGLAAAHAAGLVHRDFKPDNVLLADDGRVRVTDFGIARAVGDAGAVGTPHEADEPDAEAENVPGREVPSTKGALATPMTEDGAILGTPAYMAPEQFFGEPVDARTDQFSFCVSLYEALYGERPFGAIGSDGLTLEELLQAILAGRVREAPRGSRVAAHVRRVLLRGLSSERDARYPSLRELLADLARDPARTRRRAMMVLAGATAAFGLVAFGFRSVSERQARLCAGTEAEAREAWNDQAANRAERALLATGVPYAADTWKRTRAEIDGYMRGWKEMHRQTCEATRVHGHQSATVMTLRMSCASISGRTR